MSNQTPEKAMQSKLDHKSTTADRIWQQAEKLFFAGDKKQALVRYKRFLDHHPEDRPAITRIGSILLQIGQPLEALPYFQKAATLAPQDAASQFNLAINYNRMGNTLEGIKYTDITLELDPNFVRALIQRASNKLSAGLYDETLEITGRILVLEPDNVLAYQLKISCLADLVRVDDVKAALAELESAVTLKGKTLQLLAEICRKVDLLDEAIVYFQRAIELDNTLEASFNNLGTLLNGQNRLEEAEQVLTKGLKLFPNLTMLYVTMSSNAGKRGAYQEAVDYAQQAIEMDPDYAAPYISIGFALNKVGQHKEALLVLEKSLQLDPTNTKALVNLASTYHSLCMPEHGMKACQRALEIKPKADGALWNLALNCLAAGYIEQGWDLFGFGFASGQRLPYRPFPGLIWEGEDVSDKTFLVWREQGIGDDMRFASIYNDLSARVEKLIIETDARLVTLYQRSFPKALVRAETGTSTGRGNMKVVDFDKTAPAGLAASYLRRSLDVFPSQNAYLVPDPKRIEECREWLESLGPGTPCGLSWRSGKVDGGRSNYFTDPADWVDLMRTKKTIWINLQYTDVDDELAALKDKYDLTVHQMPGLDMKDDMEGVFALASLMKFVVSSGSSVAEIANSQGIRTFFYGQGRHTVQLGQPNVPWAPNAKYYPIQPGVTPRDQMVKTITADFQAEFKALFA